MSELRERLKKDASKKLYDVIGLLLDDAQNRCPDGVHYVDILRLAVGKRTGTLRAKVINQMANQAERELYAKYNDQQPLPLSDSDKDAA